MFNVPAVSQMIHVLQDLFDNLKRWRFNNKNRPKIV